MRSKESDLRLGQDLAEAGDVDPAYAIANKYLKRDPNDYQALTLMTHVLLQSDKPTIAYSLAKRVTQIIPKASGGWLNMGRAAADLWMSNEAIRCYKKAIKSATDDKQKHMGLVNMCATLIDSGRFEQAESYARLALDIDPDNQKIISNLGFCQLSQRNWKEGWANYHKSLGIDWRPKTQYAGEPEWDGKKTDRVVLYAEQGIGDVISFASMIPDAQKKAKIVFDVDPKLEGLMRRSFPGISVYGTRFQDNMMAWKPEDTEISASQSIGQIAEFFRLKDSDFPGTAFLKADPDRVLQWKALFETKKKPVIGVAWRGGILKTGSKYRQWSLEQLVPLLESVDAHWVSLQYRPAGEEIAAFKEKHPNIDLVEYPHATLTNDYDDTAAMVEALDHLVCMQSAVTHLAGALGKDVWVFVPQNSQWRYGGDGEDYIWSKSVRIIRQSKRGEWGEDIKRVGVELSERFSNGADLGRDDKQADRLNGDRARSGLPVRGKSSSKRPPEARQGV